MKEADDVDANEEKERPYEETNSHPEIEKAAAEASEGDAADDSDAPSLDTKSVSRGYAVFRFIALVVVLLLLVEVGVRIVYYFHQKKVDAELATHYPPNAYMWNFNTKVDYRFISLYTMNPELAHNEEYDFDSFGFRLDAQKVRLDDAGPTKKIWMLGGSTTEGLGVRANETIGAHLNVLLRDHGSVYRVVNMGQGGFNSTQELLLLIELLQSGHAPDAILCYDGINEIPFEGEMDKNGSFAWEKGTPKTALLFDVQGGETVKTLLPLTLSRLTKIDDLMRAAQRRAHAGPPVNNWDVVLRKHFTSLTAIKAIADQRRIPSFFYFQPVMGYEQHSGLRRFSAEEEKSLVPIIDPDEHKRLEALGTPAAAEQRQPLGDSFHDIHDVFRGHDQETLYADPRHPNGPGNAIIAAKIYEALNQLDAKTASPP
jgi:hypothetical protein